MPAQVVVSHRHFIVYAHCIGEVFFFALADCMFPPVTCALQAQQQQSCGLEKQSMEAGAARGARQATGPEANDLRSTSPCIPQQSRLVCAGLLLQATERAMCCALLLVVMTVTAGSQKSAGTVSHVVVVYCILCLFPSSPHAGCKCIAPAFPCISWYQNVHLHQLSHVSLGTRMFICTCCYCCLCSMQMIDS